jgi:hypothetical protein
LFVTGSPEAILFSNLPQESNYSLRAVLVCFGQVDLITEYNEPFVGLQGGHNQATVSLFYFAVVLKSF